MAVRMHVGDTDQILQAAFVHLGTNSITSISWGSSSAGTATITAIGDGHSATLHAVAAGTANITVTATRASGANLTYMQAVTVWAAAVPGVKILANSPLTSPFPDDPIGPGGGGQIPGGGNTPQ